jgi:hypothetical protein
MKIPELKLLIQNYSNEELQALAIGLYKAVPKKIKDDNCIDDFLKNPSAHGGKTTKKSDTFRSMDEIEGDVDEFVDDAEALYYSTPNRIIPKRDRPKWRFIVKRLYKEISLAAKEREDAQMAAHSLERLYKLLCKGCEVYIFNAYDVFESVGITQYDFFVRVLELHKSILPQRDFLDRALALLVENPLNRYTLHSELMRGIISFLGTPDLKYLAIETAKRMHRDAREPELKTAREKHDYRRDRTQNNLCEFVCRCFFELAEYDNALEYFEKNYRERTAEVKLYVSARLLMEYKQAERIVRVITDAEKKGIVPRDSLRVLKGHIEEHASIPEHMYV